MLTFSVQSAPTKMIYVFFMYPLCLFALRLCWLSLFVPSTIFWDLNKGWMNEWMNMLAFQPPLNHWDSLQAFSKDNAAPQYDSAVSHKCAPSARVSSSSRWCVCVCEGQRCRFIPYAGVYTRTCAVICPSACYYCHMIKILFLHAYSTCTHLYYISPLISPLHALLTDAVFVGVSRAHCGVTLYWMRSEGESCGVNGQPRLSWFMFCF